MAGFPPPPDRPPPRHAVEFYEADPAALTANVVSYLRQGLECDEGALVVATPEHREAFARALGPLRHSVVWCDAKELLSRIMLDGRPEGGVFENVIRGAAGSLTRRKLRAYGEMVGLLWSDGEMQAARELEQLWNSFLAHRAMTLFCGYPIDIFSPDFDMKSLDAVLSAHTHLLPSGRAGVLENCLDRALHEVFGAKLDGLNLLMRAEFRPAWASIPKAEATILWLRQNLPASVPAVLSRARAYYRAATS
jgi:hypothetical protein